MESSLNLKDTELRLGLPGTQATADVVACTAAARGNKRASPDTEDDDDVGPCDSHSAATPPNKAQVVGWPPIRSYRRNNSCCSEATDEKTGGGGGMYVKVSMDGVPFLRKIDIKGYDGYPHLLKALESMFKFKFIMGKCSEREAYKGSEFVPTYEDKDGDWMLLGDVPWEMFVCSCKKLRVVKESEAKGLVSNI